MIHLIGEIACRAVNFHMHIAAATVSAVWSVWMQVVVGIVVFSHFILFRRCGEKGDIRRLSVTVLSCCCALGEVGVRVILQFLFAQEVGGVGAGARFILWRTVLVWRAFFAAA